MRLSTFESATRCKRWKVTRSDRKDVQEKYTGEVVLLARRSLRRVVWKKKIFDAIEREGDDERSESRGKDGTERNEYRRRKEMGRGKGEG